MIAEMTREEKLKALQGWKASQPQRPKSKDEAFQYLIDNGEQKLVDAANANGFSDEEIIDIVHDIMLADAEEDEIGRPSERKQKEAPSEGGDDDSRPITHEEVYGSPEEDDDDDAAWEAVRGEPRQYLDPDAEHDADRMEPPQDDDDSELSLESIFGDDTSHYADSMWADVVSGKAAPQQPKTAKPKPLPKEIPVVTLADIGHPHTLLHWRNVANSKQEGKTWVEGRSGRSTWEHLPTGRQMVFGEGMSPLGQWGNWMHTLTQKVVGADGKERPFHVYHEPWTGKVKALTDRQHKWIEEQHDKLAALHGVSRSKNYFLPWQWQQERGRGDLIDRQDAINKKIAKYADTPENNYGGWGMPDWEVREQLKGQKIAANIAKYRQRAEELASTPHSNDHRTHVMDFLNTIHAGTDRGPEDIRHIREMAMGLGMDKPPENMRGLLVAMGQHLHKRSEDANIVHLLHDKAQHLASKPAGDDHWHDVFHFFRRQLPEKHANDLARMMGVPAGETPKKTRVNIGQHIWNKSLGHPAAAISTAKPNAVATVSHVDTPVDSKMPTIKK